MLRLLRFAIITLTTVLAYVLWWAYPGLFDGVRAASLISIFVLAFGITLRGLYRAQTIVESEGLASRERERLRYALADARKRAWWVMAIALVSALVVLVTVATPLTRDTPAGALIIGLLVGLNLSYLVVLRCWHEEFFLLSEEVHSRHRLRQQANDTLKRIADGRAKA